MTGRRSWLPWRRDAQPMPAERKIEPIMPREEKIQPVMPRDEKDERMEFMLSLRRRGIIDKATLRAIDEVPREHFVLPQFAATAYADSAMPIACGQTISQPYVVAYMTERLGVKRDHRVLEIGTGSGYQAAVLSRLARQVFTLERYRTLAEGARTALKTLGCGNVRCSSGTDSVACPSTRPMTASWSPRRRRRFRRRWSRTR